MSEPTDGDDLLPDSPMIDDSARAAYRDWCDRRNARMFEEVVGKGRSIAEVARAFGVTRQRGWVVVSREAARRGVDVARALAGRRKPNAGSNK